MGAATAWLESTAAHQDRVVHRERPKSRHVHSFLPLPILYLN